MAHPEGGHSADKGDEMEFYMGMVPEEEQSFEGLRDHPHNTFQSGEVLSDLISSFYC